MMIDTLEAIQAGSTTQWIRIRGVDASNPVLLLIQQGPGLPMINEARRFGHLLGLEQAFTVIYRDQRGCGRSLRRREDRTGISLEAMTGDTVSLLDYLRNRFGAKIYVAGFSSEQRSERTPPRSARIWSRRWWRSEWTSTAPRPAPPPTTSPSA